MASVYGIWHIIELGFGHTSRYNGQRTFDFDIVVELSFSIVKAFKHCQIQKPFIEYIDPLTLAFVQYVT